MTGKVLYVTAILTIIIIFGSIFVVSTDWEELLNPSENSSEITTQPLELFPESNGIEPDITSGVNYLDFSSNLFDISIRNSDYTILYFIDEDCGECNDIESNIIANRDNYTQNINIFKINISREEEISNTYDVTEANTMILVSETEEISRWTPDTLEGIIARINEPI